ncbi:hypothetical protein JOD64_003290 [Micromonospora luteifusca]|uniref:Yip1 domain-containing protein n=1 Tax=Micromonospora luteifusca TaxID=709860 RepID=A0ABS2LW69_9ACTN|nr:hypothetical protein [Micromonospora luteifusca]MBM7492068.1 hypothetical protein [Micromonospora luteifusca]
MACDSAKGGHHGFTAGWWFAAAAVALITVIAARFNAGLADFVNTDPQGAGQVREVERFATGLVYTSGQSVGQAIAMVFGVFVPVGRHSQTALMEREEYSGKIRSALWGGAGLALANLATALLIGVLAGEWLVRSAVHHDYFDPELLGDVGVIMMVLLGFVGFLVWSLVGAVLKPMVGEGRRGKAILILSTLVALALNGFVNIQLTLMVLT